MEHLSECRRGETFAGVISRTEDEATPASRLVSTAPLEDRIRELCAAVVAGEGQYSHTLAKLQSALREHNQRLRLLAAWKLLGATSPNRGIAARIAKP